MWGKVEMEDRQKTERAENDKKIKSKVGIKVITITINNSAKLNQTSAPFTK